MSDKSIIGVISVIKLSIQFFSSLVGIGSKSEDLRAAHRILLMTIKLNMFARATIEE